MKKNIIGFIVSAIIFTGCTTLPVQIEKTIAINMEDVNKIGMFQINPTELQLPVLPLIDAAAFNAKVAEVETKIKKTDDKTAKEMTEFYVEKITENTGKDTIVIANTIGNLPTNPEKNTEMFAKIAAENGIDLLVWVDSYMLVKSVTAFGVNGQLLMHNDFHVFDTRGELVGKGVIITPSTQWTGKDTIHYEIASKQFGYVESLLADFFMPVK